MRVVRSRYLYFLAIFLIVIALPVHYLVLNLSPSMPIGIYLKIGKVDAAQLKEGDLVLACLPKETQALGLARGYIDHDEICKGADAVIKQIVATPGDNLTASMTDIVVNQARYALMTKLQDSQNRTLPHIARGSYPSTSGYWLVGTNNPNSWDSRYWGPVPLQNILSQVRPLLIFPASGKTSKQQLPSSIK